MTDPDRTRLLDELARMQAHIVRLTQRVGQLEAKDATSLKLKGLVRNADMIPVQPLPGAMTANAPPAMPQPFAPFPYPDCPRLRDVFAFIEAHYHQPIGLNEIAKTFGYSPSYLTHLVRRLSGKTIYQWIIGRRMFQARYLLLQTDWTVCEIARTIGYTDTGHFVKHFRQLHDRPPKAWRELQTRERQSATG